MCSGTHNFPLLLLTAIHHSVHCSNYKCRVINIALVLHKLRNECVNLVEPQCLFHRYTQSHPVVNSAIVNAAGIVIHTYVTMIAQFSAGNKQIMTTNKVRLNMSQLLTAVFKEM